MGDIAVDRGGLTRIPDPLLPPRALRVPVSASPRSAFAPIGRPRGLLFVSGQLPIAADGTRLAGADFAAQARQVLANVDAVLAAGGLTRERLVQVRVYLVDIADWAPFNALYAEWIGAHRPARAVVPVPALHHGFRIELEAVAAP